MDKFFWVVATLVITVLLTIGGVYGLSHHPRTAGWWAPKLGHLVGSGSSAADMTTITNLRTQLAEASTARDKAMADLADYKKTHPDTGAVAPTEAVRWADDPRSVQCLEIIAAHVRESADSK